ncbi:MAG TPA: DUF934 domain-containing protein [Rhizomicrobium sp.]|nr:DUF934 domain-containing protein [Rhizomicrobium sp.]
MPLIKNGTFAEDGFQTVADDAPLPANGTIVSLARFGKERENLLARNAPLGVRLKSDESPEALGEDVHRLSVVVLEFPKFRDGRGFSWARMLRTRLKYQGEIRATGHFLYDQLAYMKRVGIDAFEVRENITPADFNRAMSEMTYVYQPSADGRTTIRDLRTAR